jgi:YesN/AraC family two-component response regulator
MPTAPQSQILVVDDDPDFRANLVEWLEDSGYVVAQAANGKEAMDRASDTRFSVVVTDLKMPEANGLELLEWFKLTHPSTAVIFLSGQATVQDAIQALREWGGFDFLEKPIEMPALSAIIERAIALSAPKGARGSGPLSGSFTRSQDQPPPPQPEPASAPLSAFAERALQLIAERFREPIGLSELSVELGYSAAYLTNTLRRETGKTVLQWIIHHRLEEAKRLMSETDWSGQQIAQAVGYAHYSHFLRQFRQSHGVPPSAWRAPSKSP